MQRPQHVIGQPAECQGLELEQGGPSQCGPETTAHSPAEHLWVMTQAAEALTLSQAA